MQFYIDNLKYDEENTFTVTDSLKTNSLAPILFCTTSLEYYDRLRENIYQVYDATRIVELFRNSASDAYVDITDYFAGEVSCGEFLLDRNQKTQDKLPKDIYEELNFLEQCNNDSDMSKQEKERYQGLFDFIKASVENGLICRNPGNHFIPDYEFVVNHGIDGLKERNSDNKEYIRLLTEFEDYVSRYAESAKRCGNERIRKSCERIANDKPKTLFDAIQLIILVHQVLASEAGCGSLSFGRMDQYLYPFYLSDIENDRIKKEDAQQYVIEFFKKLMERQFSWQNVTIGGCDKKGNDQSNDLTLMFLKSKSIVRGDQPQLSLRTGRNTSDEVWDCAMNLMSLGMGFPSLFNDEVAVEAKIHSQVRMEDAVNYAVMGCVELCIPGKEYAHTEGMRLNWAKTLENLLRDIDVNRTSFESFEDFYKAYKERLIDDVTKLCEFIDYASGMYPKKWSVPFASCLMERRTSRSTDVTDNGTVYNNLVINCVGVATTADSLQAVKELVYEKKRVSLGRLSSVCVTGTGFDEIQKEMDSCQKYGNDIDEVDDIAADLIQTINNLLLAYKLKYRTGCIMPGYYSSYFHSDFGKLTCATPDGRTTHVALSPSLSAASGRDRNGLLALLQSAEKVDMRKMGNGAALDIKLVPSFFDNINNREGLKNVIKTYFANGGLEIQVNVVDKETLIDAKKHPEKHRNLIVRVSGFSAYFTCLDDELQDEIIARTEM